jgi:hypothetical protein
MDETLKVFINNTTVDIDFEENDLSTTNLRRIENNVLIDAERKLSVRCGNYCVTLYPFGMAMLRKIKG